MANLSDATVDIFAEKVGKELVEYIRATNETPTDYAIVYDNPSLDDVDENGNIEIHSGSSGRWAYANNLEGYFDTQRVKSWLGVGDDYTWAKEESRDKYRQESEKSYSAFLKLMQAIKEKDGRVEISYTDCDPAMDWMSTGGAVLEVMDGEVNFSQSDESETLSISGFAGLQDISGVEAIEWLHGDEVSADYEKYLAECKEKGDKPVSADEWYDKYVYEEE